MASGWAADRSQLNVPIDVTIFIDGNAVATILANGNRPDVGSVLGDNGFHGYQWNIPAQYKDGNPHTVTARFAGSSQELSSTPKSLNCVGSGNPNPPTPPTNPNPPTTGSLNPYSGDAYFVNGVVGIGTTNVGDRSALLSVKGKIRAQEIRVETNNWPDYVFAPGYKLPPLPALETYVNTHRHLPGVPSAQEVTRNGVLLGDMNARLLEKIEELTLQLIALEKRTRQQERKLARFRRQRISTHTR